MSKIEGDDVAEMNLDEDLKNDFGLDEDQAALDLNSDTQDLVELESTQVKKNTKKKT